MFLSLSIPALCTAQSMYSMIEVHRKVAMIAFCQFCCKNQPKKWRKCANNRLITNWELMKRDIETEYVSIQGMLILAGNMTKYRVQQQKPIHSFHFVLCLCFDLRFLFVGDFCACGFVWVCVCVWLCVLDFSCLFHVSGRKRNISQPTTVGKRVHCTQTRHHVPDSAGFYKFRPLKHESRVIVIYEFLIADELFGYVSQFCLWTLCSFRRIIYPVWELKWREKKINK